MILQKRKDFCIMKKEPDIEKCSRNGFKGCYFDASGYGTFKGEVIKIKDRSTKNHKNIRYLFKRIYVEYDVGLDIIKDKEDHVWIFSAAEFKDNGIGIGDCVSFAGQIKPYRRKDGSYDLGIEDPSDIRKIDSYELPSDEKLQAQFMERLKCETCLFADHCDGIFCMMP